jgi:hypothetical protein
MSDQVRLFTLDDASKLLPVLRPMLRAIQNDKRRIDELHAQTEGITPAMATNGHANKVTEIEVEMAQRVQTINSAIHQITEMGVELKDLDLGLVDFPSVRDDRVVYLCWNVDEPSIAFWHEVDAGVAGRQPL